MQTKKIIIPIFVLLIIVVHSFAEGTEKDSLLLKIATTHPMQYYVSLPEGWNKNKKWPVVVILEAAEKEFQLNAERFMQARKKLPFILVAPVIVTNGNYGKRDPKIYPYSPAVWDQVDKGGVCDFDMNGLQAVMKDVRAIYNGEEKFYITGFEAGTHLLWAMVFQHPEQLLAAVPVAGNYRSRCMENQFFSADPSKAKLPVRAMYGEKDTSFGKHGAIFTQWLNARKIAEQHGFATITEEEVKGKEHVPLPNEVIGYFASLFKKTNPAF